MQINPVETSLGIVNGRDAIYLDSSSENMAPKVLTLKGEFNGRLCSENDTGRELIPYCIHFRDVQFTEVVNIDNCAYELELLSSFDEVVDSELLKLKGIDSTYNHYRFVTYDYAYQIICKGFDLELDV